MKVEVRYAEFAQRFFNKKGKKLIEDRLKEVVVKALMEEVGDFASVEMNEKGIEVMIG